MVACTDTARATSRLCLNTVGDPQLKAYGPHAEYCQVLVSITASSTAQTVNPRDVIVAMVGGTMLTLALSRPRLKWLEQMTEDSASGRLWTERGLTILAFSMGGYAWASLFMVLHKQLGPEISTMLRGSAVFLIAYAWLVHFEPFVVEWRLNGWVAAAVLYTGVATFAVSIGVAIADSWLTSGFVNTRMLLLTGGFAACCWLAYKLIPRLEALVERL